ncbi:hypothetical protein [Streptosporangium sandarakinum]
MAVTTYEYDDVTGRLVRSVTRREPEWLEDDRDWALAQMREEANRCRGGCGMPLDETTDPANASIYEAPPPVRCRACATLAERQAEYKEDTDGLMFHVRRKDV